MTKIIKGNLILTKETFFKESIVVEGDITGYFDLKVAGNITAWNINAWNIDAWNINARNIIFCNKIKVKLQVFAKKLITNRFRLEVKEQSLVETKA